MPKTNTTVRATTALMLARFAPAPPGAAPVVGPAGEADPLTCWLTTLAVTPVSFLHVPESSVVAADVRMMSAH